MVCQSTGHAIGVRIGGHQWLTTCSERSVSICSDSNGPVEWLVSACFGCTSAVMVIFHRFNLNIFAPKKIRGVVQTSSKAPCSFWNHWRRFEEPQFRARISGHCLSRLEGIRHNMTKQSSFPTIRGKGPKTRATTIVHFETCVPFESPWGCVYAWSERVWLVEQNAFFG